MLLKVSHCVFKGTGGVITQFAALTYAVQHLRLLAAQIVQELALKAADILGRHAVEVALGAGPDDGDLLLDGQRRGLRLLQQLDHARTAIQLGTRSRVEVGGEHGERFHLAELSQVDL